MTLDHFDEDELLAFIEGELEPDEAARLEHALANSPRAAMLVERMRRDRELLRSTPEPHMPRNFLAGIESRLARPMLMEALSHADRSESSEPFVSSSPPPPGAMRRQHRQAMLRKRLTKIAMAASIALTIGAAMWVSVLMTGLHVRAGEWIAAMLPDRPAAETERDDASGGSHMTSADRDSRTKHHNSAAQRDGGETIAADNQYPAERAVIGLPSIDPSNIGLLLVVHAEDSAATEFSLAELIAAFDERPALVRNMTDEHALRLASTWMRSQGGRADRIAPPSPSAASGTGSSRHRSGRPNDRTTDPFERLRDRLSDDVLEEFEQSGRLTGDADSSAGYDLQLALSRRGATHTISITASKLHELLAKVHQMPDVQTMLTLLPDRATAEDEDFLAAPQTWLTQRRDVQQLLSMVDRLPPDVTIHFPLRIENHADR